MIDDRLVVDPQVDLPGRIHAEQVVAGRGGRHVAGPGDAAVAGRDDARLATGGVETGHPRQRDGIPEIAEPGERRVVPEDAVAAARHQERNEDLGVVLAEIEVVVLDVEQPLLVLSQTVEGLVGVRLPLLANVGGLLALHGGGGQSAAAALTFGEDRLAVRIEEGHPPGLLDPDAEAPGRVGDLAGAAAGLPARGLAAPRRGREARAGEERGVPREHHPHDVWRTELDLQHPPADAEDRRGARVAAARAAPSPATARAGHRPRTGHARAPSGAARAARTGITRGSPAPPAGGPRRPRVARGAPSPVAAAPDRPCVAPRTPRGRSPRARPLTASGGEQQEDQPRTPLPDEHRLWDLSSRPGYCEEKPTRRRFRADGLRRTFARAPRRPESRASRTVFQREVGGAPELLFG